MVLQLALQYGLDSEGFCEVYYLYLVWQCILIPKLIMPGFFIICACFLQNHHFLGILGQFYFDHMAIVGLYIDHLSDGILLQCRACRGHALITFVFKFDDLVRRLFCMS